MDELREYLFGVVAVAVICGILTRLTDGKSTTAVAVRLTAGFVLLLAVVRPWANMDLEHILDWTEKLSANGSIYVSDGKNAADESYRASIKEQTEAYIVDEAKALHCDIQVEVILSSQELAVPKTVKLTGDVSPYARQALNTVLMENLGIEREEIIWT